MTTKTLLTLHAVVYAMFAIALFFFANSLWPIYGLQINDASALFLSQHNSIFLGGLAIIAWLWRDVEVGSQAASKVLSGFMWTNLLGVVITLYACFIGTFTGFGWSDPAFFAFLFLLCAVQLRHNRAATSAR